MLLKKIPQNQNIREKTSSVARATLLSYGLFDEIITGLPIVGLPLLRDYLGLSYQQIGLLFTVGSGSALLLEPLINILSDRHSKRYWVLGGLLAARFGLLAGLALLASAPLLLLLALIRYPKSARQ